MSFFVSVDFLCSDARLRILLAIPSMFEALECHHTQLRLSQIQSAAVFQNTNESQLAHQKDRNSDLVERFMVIDQFIWSFQHHFRFKCEYEAREILRKLDADLTPQVFLVGLRRPETTATHGVCIEPETDHWISATDFDGLMDSTKVAFDNSEDRQFFVSDPYSAKRLHDESFRRTIRDQIASVIRSHDRSPPNMEFTVAVPEVVGDYWVSIVIGLQRSVVERYPRLSSNQIVLHQFHKIPVPVSIIESVKDCLLERMAEALHLPDSGRTFLRIESDELMREAGQRFVEGIVLRVDADRCAGAKHLFTNLNIMSSIRYEGSEASGELLLGPRASMDSHFCVQFSKPVELAQHRRR